MNNFAWVTLVTKSNYEACAGRLYQSLQYFKSRYPMEILVSDDLQDTDLTFLINHNIKYKKIKKIVFYPKPIKGRTPVYNDTFSKLLVLNLKQYDYVCFIDADMLITDNIDYLWNIIDLSKEVNCYYRQPDNVPGGELFFINPHSTSVNKLINFVNAYTTLNPTKWIKNDEILLQLYYDTKINKIEFSFDNILHCSGYIKFWTILCASKWLQWFYEDSIEDFIKKLKLNYNLILNILNKTKNLVSIQFGETPYEQFRE